ncbi:hypothetical protein JCM6882_007053 [Rhodosporidiobolus microsporus]
MPAIRLRAAPLLDAFLGFMDLKLGCVLVSLFCALNKFAGAFGALSIFLTGGSALSQPLAQVSMYGYSLASLAAIIWGGRKIAEEDGDKVLLYSHFFALDHLLNTLYTAFFAVVWYAWVPHDGRRVANSDAQKAMMGGSQTGGGMDDASRLEAARQVWEGERGFSATVLVIGWLLKVYFILTLYSFALHLRRGTYANLPNSIHNRSPSPKYCCTPGSTRRRAYSGIGMGAPPGRGNHTRIGSAGGAPYTHLRGNSLASTAGIGGGRGSIDGLDGTETTLAETLWEDEDDVAPSGAGAAPSLGDRRGSRGPLPAPVSTRLNGRGDDAVPPSPAFAKGTGMARQPSGSAGAGVTVSGGSSGVAKEDAAAKGADAGQATNPFTSILGRMSQDVER